MIVTRTVDLSDPLARANVVDAFRGPGRPAGVTEVVVDGTRVTLHFDDAVSEPDLIDDLVAIESVFVPAHSQGALAIEAAAAMAAAGLADPELDVTRVIETYLREPRP